MAKRDRSDYVQLNLRIKEHFRQKIEEAAREHNVSMNSEVIDRLERSFETDQRIQDIFGSEQVFGIMKIIASIMNEIGRSEYYFGNKLLDHGILWLSDATAYNQAFEAAKAVLETLRPAGEIVKSKPFKLPNGPEFSRDQLGEGTALAKLEQIAQTGDTPGYNPPKIGDAVREKLKIPPPAKGRKAR